MEINAGLVKELRAQTGCGIMDCKVALKEAGGDITAAIEWLRKKGMKTAEKKAGRTANQGAVASYIHPGNRVGVLLELNCETDFVARTEQFQQLHKDLMLQVAASSPRYLAPEDVPPAILAKEQEIYEAQIAESGKPENIRGKIVEGRIKKWYQQVCLLEQPFVKDPDTKIRDLVAKYIGGLGENITVRRFTRYELGEQAD